MVTTTLENRVNNVLDILEESGYSKHTISNYHIAFKRLLKKATDMHTENLTEKLIQEFVTDSEDSRKGGYSHSRKCLQLSCIRKLEECEERGYVGWKPYAKSKFDTPKNLKFKKLRADFLKYLEVDGKSKNTISYYRNISSKFLIFIEKSSETENNIFTKELIMTFFIELNKTWSPGSFRTAASALRSFLIFSNNAELADAIPRKLLNKRTIIPILTQDEELAVMSVLTSNIVYSRNKAIVLLLLLTGIRAVDIVNLKLNDIDWNCNLISIMQKKTGKLLTLPLLPAIGNAIATYIINDRPKSSHPFVFLSRVSPHGPLEGHSGCYYVIKDIFRIAGIRLGNDEIKGSRLFRHSITSKMLHNGVAIQTISSILGHSDLNTVDVYITTNKEKMRQCALSIPSSSAKARGLK